MAPTAPLAVVTGTTSGIGLELTGALLDKGWQVVGLARRSAPLDHQRYTHVVVDLGDSAALDHLCGGLLRQRLSAPDLPRVGLVNNAAMIGVMGWLETAGAGHLGNLFAVNAAAPMALMGLARSSVPATTPLRVVNISSGAAHSPLPGLADYSASKAALRMAGRSAAAEFEAAGLTPAQAAVFSYEPGLVDTAMQDAAQDAPADTFPSHGIFREFLAQGLLNPPGAVVGEILDFLEGDPAECFTERRYGDA